MKEERKDELRRKGWTEGELSNMEEIVDKPKTHDVHFSQIVFWSALVVIIFANLIVSLVLIPFLIVLNAYVLYGIVLLLAGTIGFLYNFLINDIGHLNRRHHQTAAVIIPVIALVNLAVMVLLANKFIVDLEIQNEPHNIWLVSAVFVVAFIIPYVVARIRER